MDTSTIVWIIIGIVVVIAIVVVIIVMATGNQRREARLEADRRRAADRKSVV